ncbi:MAG: glutamyl-tRNA reductase [Ignavibacteria bacterium]|nr:MAG: glutamyl-tRNA reductase [Ignavibacteria bacterium]
MNLLAVSINHKTAPINLRESVYLSENEVRELIEKVKSKYFTEGLLISTCNRTEIYGIPANTDITHSHLQKIITESKNSTTTSADNFQTFVSRDSLNHLFSVIAGIDSMLIGDNQVFKQVKDSFQIAEEMQFAGFLMRRVFDSALKVGKRAISETAITEGAVTVSYAAVQLIGKIFSNLNKKSALIVGTGETGEIAAKNLRDRGIGRLALTNRSFEKAEKLAADLNTAVFPFDTFKDHLHKFDIIISATSAEGIVITRSDVEAAMKKRNFASMVLMDIAVPRDIDPASKEINYVFYHDIDSLNIIVEQNVSKRREEIPKVEKIIDEELNNFFEWYNSLKSAPTIKNLKDHFDAIRAEEVEKNINKFSSEDREKLEIVTKRIINKILHHPIVELKKTNETGTGAEEVATKMGIIRSLFGINTPDSKENKHEQKI